MSVQRELACKPKYGAPHQQYRTAMDLGAEIRCRCSVVQRFSGSMWEPCTEAPVGHNGHRCLVLRPRFSVPTTSVFLRGFLQAASSYCLLCEAGGLWNTTIAER